MTVIEEQDIGKLVREHCHAAVRQHSDIDEAIEYALNLINGSAEVREWTLRKAVQEVVYEVRASLISREKRYDNSSKRDAEGIDALNAANAQSILELWMVGNKPLGDLTKEELSFASDREIQLAMGHKAVSEFYRKLAGRVKGNKTVRQCLKAAAVRKLWEETKP